MSVLNLMSSAVLLFGGGSSATIIDGGEIVLTETNHIALHGAITSRSSQLFRQQIFERHPPQPPLYVYINSPGGSVDEGMRMIHALPDNAICIAEVAYSMAFAFLQRCATRIVLPYSSLMQHQIHFSGGGLTGDLARLQAYIDFTARQYEVLQQQQADRIGVPRAWFDNRTRDEWWIYGTDAVLLHRCADYTVRRITCDATLTKKRRFIMHQHRMLQLSACPLLWPSFVGDDDDAMYG